MAPQLHAPFLERASESGSRERAHGLGAFLTLRVVDRIAGDSGDIGGAALTYQLNACANYLDELQPQTKAVKHLREIVRVAKRASALRRRRLLWPPLLAFAYWLEQEFRVNESLDVLDTVLRLSDGSAAQQEVAAYLQRGRVLRLAGRFEEAAASYTLAEELAERVDDLHSQMVSRVGRAKILQKTGDLPGSEQAIREVLVRARGVGDRDIEAKATHDLSVTMHLMDRPLEAIPLAYQAFELYEEDEARARALGDTGVFLKGAGHYAAARNAFMAVLGRNPPRELRVRAFLELLELGALVHDRVGFERCRRELDAQYGQLPPDELVDFEMKLGEGLLAFENWEDAVLHLSRAVQLAEQYRLGQRVFTAEQLLRELREGIAQANVSRGRPAPPERPELEATIQALQEMAAGSG